MTLVAEDSQKDTELLKETKTEKGKQKKIDRRNALARNHSQIFPLKYAIIQLLPSAMRYYNIMKTVNPCSMFSVVDFRSYPERFTLTVFYRYSA